MYHMRKRVATFFVTSFKVKAFTRLKVIESLSFIIITGIVQWG